MKADKLQDILAKRKPIAEGAGGAIYKLRYNNKLIALKILPYEDWEHEYYTHYDIYKTITSNCKHNIPEIIDIGVTKITLKNKTYGVIPMRFVYGTTLRKFIYESYEDTKKMRDTLVSILKQIRRILLNLWSVGYIHGDLHLGNIIITPTKRVMLIDFQCSGQVQPLKIDNITSMHEIKRWFVKQWKSNYPTEHENADYAIYEIQSMGDKAGMFYYEEKILKKYYKEL